ncbi:hypothetical protein ACFU8I_33545, partial [Streptomyces sp. NPDC057540]|uniref:hypothetical protein n=1 Tax=Streptomyces sp. NPDC057540 TaxID=3346160 RepID=UPI00369D4417
TETSRRHTVVLTDSELESLREAARVALLHTDQGIYTNDWRALRRLGKSPTRSFVEEHTNPAMIGTSPSI